MARLFLPRPAKGFIRSISYLQPLAIVTRHQVCDGKVNEPPTQQRRGRLLEYKSTLKECRRFVIRVSESATHLAAKHRNTGRKRVASLTRGCL